MPSGSASVSLARVLSKLGYCSRSQATVVVASGRVRVNGTVRHDPAFRLDPGRDRVAVDGVPVRAAARVYLMLNKPAGLVTTTSDEKDRPTVYRCLENAGLPWVGPVGRLDKASEGLLLFTNDTLWAERLLSPASGLEKSYHVQVGGSAEDRLLSSITAGVELDGQMLRAVRAAVLRQGTRNTWLDIVLDEGKNRHIRRLLGALGVDVLRLVRVAVGPLRLGGLSKGSFRHLADSEICALTPSLVRSSPVLSPPPPRRQR